MRSSHFSLNFLTIGPSNPSETRGKVEPPLQELHVGTSIMEFQQLWEVGVFFNLDILCLKIHENGFGCCEVGNGHGFQFQEVEPILDEGVILEQPTD